MEAIKFAVRQAKLDKCGQSGLIPFVRTGNNPILRLQAQSLLPEEDGRGPEVSVAGRIVAFRLMGKASFLKDFGS